MISAIDARPSNRMTCGDTRTPGDPAKDPDKGERQQLDRMLASATFRQVGRLKRFLSFIVLETLLGRGDQLKEYVIGVQVFDKDSSFDPRADPIVRVQARRLRARLVRYYREEGGPTPSSSSCRKAVTRRSSRRARRYRPDGARLGPRWPGGIPSRSFPSRMTAPRTISVLLPGPADETFIASHSSTACA